MNVRSWPLRRKILVGVGGVLIVGVAVSGGEYFFARLGETPSASAGSSGSPKALGTPRATVPSAAPTPTPTPSTFTVAPAPRASSSPGTGVRSPGSGSGGRNSGGHGGGTGGGTVIPPVTTPPPTKQPAPQTWEPTQAEVDAAVEAATGVKSPGLPIDGDCQAENYGSTTGGTPPAVDEVSPIRVKGTTLAFEAHPIVDGLFVQYYACA